VLPRAPTTLLAFTLLLVAGAAAVLVAGSPGQARREARSREFQRLVGGLGFGPATDLSACPFGFDPRLCPDCARDLGPIPGGRYFCPHHAGAVFDYPPLPAAHQPSGG
jgi:hypothetical protein